MSGFIYILQLEKEKFYIGFTERKDGERINEHFKGNGSEWTKKYKPLQLLELRECKNIDEEDKTTLELMKKYGWWNVRGGRWVTIEMDGPPKELWKAPSVGIFDSILNKLGNLISSLEPGETPTTSTGCFRCGRQNHWAKDCYAKYHLNGKPLK